MKERETLENQYNAAQHELSALRNSVNSLQSQSSLLQQQLQQGTITQNNYTNQLQALNSQINTTNQQINLKQANFNGLQEKLKLTKNTEQTIIINQNNINQKILQTDEQTRKYSEVLLNLDSILAKYSKFNGVNINTETMLIKITPPGEGVNSELAKKICEEQSIKSFNEVIEKIDNINSVDSNGMTLLMYALKHGFWYGTEKLLEMGADVDIIDNNGCNALMYACSMPHIKYTKAIAEKVRDINYKANGFDDSAALHLLIANTNTIWFGDESLESVTDYRVQSRVKSDAFDFKNGNLTVTGNVTISAADVRGIRIEDSITKRPLTIASVAGEGGYTSNQEKIRVIIKQFTDLGADINTQDSKDMTPFFVACDYGFTYLVHKLFNQYSNIMDFGLTDIHGNTHLHYIARVPNAADIVPPMLAQNININAQNKGGGTPALQAAMRNNIETLKFLMEHGADINILDVEGRHPWHYASQYGALDSMKFLRSQIPNIIDLKTANAVKSTALQAAAEIGQLPLVQWLAGEGADINAKTADQGLTPFFIACIKKHSAIAEYFFNHPRFSNSVIDNLGYGSLHWALEFREKSWVDKILNKGGIDISGQDVNGITALAWAAAYNLPEIVTSLLNKGANPQIPSKSGVLPVHQAAANGALDVIKLLIKPGIGNVNQLSTHHQTPLWFAAQEGKLEAVKFLISLGANVNAVHSINGLTPLYVAMFNKHKLVVNELLGRKADIDIITSEGNTALHWSLDLRDIEICKFLLQKGIDVNAKNNEGITALQWAVSNNEKDMVRLLLEHKADANILISESEYLLAMAVSKGDFAIFKLLTDHPSTNLNCRSLVLKLTPLWVAAQDGKIQMLEYLITKGADINLPRIDNMLSPLHVALQKGHFNILLKLLDSGANVNSFDLNKNSVLHYAIAIGNINAIKSILEKNPELNCKNDAGITPFYQACSKDNLQVIQELKNSGADINILNNAGYHPIHAAIHNGYTGVVEELIKWGINIDIKSTTGYTALQYYCEQANAQIEVVEFLLSKGASLNCIQEGIDNKTLLHSAVVGGNLQIIDFIITKGLDINIVDAKEVTPLYGAFGYYKQPIDFDIVSVLIARGANVNKPMNDGDTPMHMAFHSGRSDLIKLLLEKGANIKVENADKKLPLHSLLRNNALPPEAKVKIIKELKSVLNKEGIDVLNITKEFSNEVFELLSHNENDGIDEREELLITSNEILEISNLGDLHLEDH